MGFTAVDWINLIALLLSVFVTFIMFYYSPVVNSQVFLYRKIEMQKMAGEKLYWVGFKGHLLTSGFFAGTCKNVILIINK